MSGSQHMCKGPAEKQARKWVSLAQKGQYEWGGSHAGGARVSFQGLAGHRNVAAERVFLRQWKAPRGFQGGKQHHLILAFPKPPLTAMWRMGCIKTRMKERPVWGCGRDPGKGCPALKVREIKMEIKWDLFQGQSH